VGSLLVGWVLGELLATMMGHCCKELIQCTVVYTLDLELDDLSDVGMLYLLVGLKLEGKDLLVVVEEVVVVVVVEEEVVGGLQVEVEVEEGLEEEEEVVVQGYGITLNQ